MKCEDLCLTDEERKAADVQGSKGTKDQVIETDILVIGGGMSGAMAAVKAKEGGTKNIILVSKGKLGKDSCATFAAGVFTCILPEDDKEALFKTYALDEALGTGLYNEQWLKIFLAELYDRILDLEKWGLQWQKTPDGKFERRKMRGNLRAMFEGPKLMEVMAKTVRRNGVNVMGHTMITDLLTEKGKPGNRVTGAVGFDVRTGEFRTFKAKSTILAAGPCGFKGRYACHKFQTGEAYAMAYRAGAVLGQFETGHHLQLCAADFDTQGMNMFISLGGRFLNSKGERFMPAYDPDLGDNSSLANVAAAMAMEVRAGRGPIYLDMTHFRTEDIARIRTVLPIPTKMLERAGALVGDRIVKKMEWQPALWGTTAIGGGVVVNTRCETSLPGLFACGDAVARHLSKPSALPGAAITGARAGESAALYIKRKKALPVSEKQLKELKKSTYAPLDRKDGVEPDHIIIAIQEVLFPYEVTVISRGDRLEKAIAEIQRIRNEEVPLLYASDAHYLRLAAEVQSMALVAEMFLKSRLLREESRGTFLREDYPYTDNVNWIKNTRLKQENGKMKFWTEEIPRENYRLKPEKKRYLHPIFKAAKERGVAWG
jgi:succinate dehydrogenase/fumarate reductase flavoprotein subunit